MHEVDGSKVYRLFYPSVPVVVATRAAGRVSGMPVVSILSGSNSPPRIAFSSTPTHDTHRMIVEAGAFSVAWLDETQVRSLELLGTSSGAGVADKLASSGLEHRRGTTLDVPVIEGASAALECSVSEVRPLGDHELIVGDVRRAFAKEDFGEYWEFDEYRPILYCGMGGGFQLYRGSKVQ